MELDLSLAEFIVLGKERDDVGHSARSGGGIGWNWVELGWCDVGGRGMGWNEEGIGNERVGVV